MSKQKMIDANEIIGIYPICNTGAVLLYKIDYAEDRVLASINTDMPEWCQLAEEYIESSGDVELGFRIDALFVPLFEVQRFYSMTC